MEWIHQWVRNLAFFFVFLSALMNFLPGGEEKKYIRFFMGMLLLLILVKPILGLGDLGEFLEQQVLADSIEESFAEMMRETDQQEITGADYVKNACERQVEEQIGQLMEGYGYQVKECRISFFDGDVLEMNEIVLRVKKKEQAQERQGEMTETWTEDSGEEQEKFLKNKLEEVYNIPVGNINISIQG